MITDHNGVLMYTKTLPEDVQKYLDLLVVGGRFFFTLQAHATPLNGSRDRESLRKWLDAIERASVGGTTGDDG